MFRPAPIKVMPLMGFGTFIGNMESDDVRNSSLMLKMTEEAVLTALKSGYRHIDCASGYGNETAIGDALTKAFSSVESGGLGLKREDIWITSKGSNSAPSLTSTLKNLGVTYVDLHLSHHPAGFEDQNSLVEYWTEMNKLVDSHQTRYIGVSNQYHEHITRLVQICRDNELRLPYANEIELHPKLQDSAFVQECQQEGIKLIAYSPLGYRNNPLILEDEVIKAIAKQHSATPAQVTLAWNMARGITVIPKSKTEDRIKENFAASTVKLSTSDMSAIAAIDWGMAMTGSAEAGKKAALSVQWEVQKRSLKK